MKRLGRSYWKLWTASVTSNFGDGISTVAYPWLASAVTRDPIQIALIGVASRLPWLVFTLPAGVITDRVDRKKLIVAMDLLRFAITATVAAIVATAGSDLAAPGSLASGSAANPDHRVALLLTLYGSALAFGFAEVLRDNAAQTILPTMVDSDLLETANGRMWGAEMVMNSFVGPPLGGLLIASAFALPFVVDAGTFAVSAALIFSITGASFRAPRSADERTKTFRSEMSEGVRWLWRNGLLRRMAIILGFMNALFSAAMAVYVLFVQEILELDASSFGILLTAGAVGGVVGSVLASRISTKIGSGTSLFTVLIVQAVGFAVTGTTSSAIVVWVMFTISSFTAVLWNVITVSLRQTIIPDALLGRVNSVYRFFAWGMMPVGAILGGAIVAITEAVSDRDLALRMPFLIASASFVLLYVYARPVLNTAAIEAARASAQSGEDETETTGLPSVEI